jgi:hypothetical protein
LNIIDFKPEELNNLVQDLICENFEPHITSVGGSGLGIPSPYSEHRNTDISILMTENLTLGQVTPPDPKATL